jgi:SAM-dependent methyltransferase/predicted MFS family arabinose efflux permease
VGTKPTSAVPIFLLVVGCGTALAFSAPAGRSLPADAVEPERLPWLIARSSVAFQAGIVAGPVVGGFLFTVDARLPFAAVALLLVVMSTAVMMVRLTSQPRRRRRPGEADEPEVLLARAAQEAGVGSSIGITTSTSHEGLHEATEGLRFVRSQPILLGAISLDLLAVLFGGAVALLPAIAKDRLGVGVVGLGWLRAAAGMGAGAATAVLTIRPITRGVGRTLLAVVALFGVFTIVLGVTRDFAVAFVAIVALSAADAISVFIRATLVPLLTPGAKRGRVLAVENVFIGGSNELGAFESGVAGQLLGTSGSVVLGGVTTIAVALGWWYLFPMLRDLDGFPVSADLEDSCTAPGPGDDVKHVVASGYDRIAERYADWSPATPSGPKTKYLNVALRLVPSGGEALDLGCGTGQHLTRHLVAHYRVTGVDLSSRSIALARQQVPEADFLLADMATLDLPSGSFDLITAFYSFIHVPRREHPAVLARIRSWLRPGGVLIATMAAGAGGEGVEQDWLGTPMYWSNWDAQTNRRLITDAGLELLDAVEETELEGDVSVTHLWVVARRPD